MFPGSLVGIKLKQKSQNSQKQTSMRKETVVQSTRVNWTKPIWQIGGSSAISCNCPYAIRPQLCLLALGEQILVTEAFFHEQTHVKHNQETHPTQRESSAFSTETFRYFLTVTVCTEPTLFQVIYISRYICDQPEQIALKSLHAHHSLSKHRI